MSEFPAHDRAELTVRLDTGRAVEVSDLGRSLQALGKQYEEFVVALRSCTRQRSTICHSP